jgi:hypothetical protein
VQVEDVYEAHYATPISMSWQFQYWGVAGSISSTIAVSVQPERNHGPPMKNIAQTKLWLSTKHAGINKKE